MAFELRRVNAHDDHEFMAWFGVLNRAEIERDEGRHDGWLPQEWRAQALDETASSYRQLFSYGPDALNPVAAAALQLTRDDNLEWTRADLFVDPLRRRRGHGRATLALLEAKARELARATIAVWAIEGAHQVRTAPNRSFAPRFGYRLTQENIQRDLAWPRPKGELDRLQREWSPHARDYDVLSWVGATPPELLAGRAHLSSIMPLEVPGFGVEVEAKQWSEINVRENEHLVDDMGRDRMVAVARARASGELVGFSELTVSRERPRVAYQWDTLVVRAHRGHRLGGLLKLATMRRLEEGRYPTDVIKTFNAADNAPMIAVNEALGARVAGCMAVWSKSL